MAEPEIKHRKSRSVLFALVRLRSVISKSMYKFRMDSVGTVYFSYVCIVQQIN